MARKTKNQTVGVATAVTVLQPVSLGLTMGLFSVQGGVPLPNAVDALSLILETVHSVADETAQACSENDTPGTARAIELLLALAQALNYSIHAGLYAARCTTDMRG